MRWRRGEVEQVVSGCVGFGVVGEVRWLGFFPRLGVLAGLVCVCVLVGAAGAVAGSCPNAAFRSGASAGLPDCRAYELVTPANKGRTQALTFTEGAEVVVSGDGEEIALGEATVAFGPNPSFLGTRAVFSRTAKGWAMSSAVAPGASEHNVAMRLFTPDLSQVAFQSETALNAAERSPDITFEAGPVGGPYALVASVPREGEEAFNTEFLGASADFGHVLLTSVDHELPLLSGVEAATSLATDGGADNLYDWSGGHLRLVNAKQDGSPLANPCGATLGAGGGHESNSTVHAVSGDGSRVFFTVPSPAPFVVSGPGCEKPARLFMRVDGGEPVEVSAPEPGVTPASFFSVRYNYATPDGSKVFFNTETALTADDSSNANKLFEYDTEAPEGKRLRRIAGGVPASSGVGLEATSEGFYFNENGSAVYVEYQPGSGEFHEIYRYETSTGKQTFVARAYNPHGAREPSYSTPNGEFFLFTSKRLIEPPESRGTGPQFEGTGPNEMYRYDHADGSVVCVTCGAGDAPAQGEVIGPFGNQFKIKDEVPPAWSQISGDGSRVFFQTTAQLVPQDTNSTETDLTSSRGLSGLDVYEWEAKDSEVGPGVFCGGVNGCTYLLSSGEDVGPARFLGASASGSDVFFESASPLAPQDMDEFPDIYDARVDGGFAPSPPLLPCLSCQGVGSPPPLFSVTASESFVGAGNPVARVVEEKQKQKLRQKRQKKGKKKGKGKRKMRGRSRTKGGRGLGVGGGVLGRVVGVGGGV